MKAKLIAEFFGTALLLVSIVGSGIMADNLSMGNDAIALLANSIATGCGLYVLISILEPISGAHFNPAVSFMFWRAGGLDAKSLISYSAVQVLGGVLGVFLTNLMFSLPIIQSSSTARTGTGIWVSELVSTIILLSVIWLAVKYTKEKVAMLVALVVTGGYWFTSSTFFANPAVAIGRVFSDTFAGIQLSSVPMFLLMQMLGTALVCILLVRKNSSS